MFAAARKLNTDIYNFLFRKYENLELINSLEKEIRDRQNAEKKLMLKNQQIEIIVEKRTAELQKVNSKLLSEIDDRIEAEKALRESEEKYRELANSLPQMVFETDVNGTITFANHNTFDFLGYSKKEFKNIINVSQIITTDNKAQMQALFSSMAGGKKLKGDDYLAQTKSGDTFPIEIHSTPIIRSNRFAGMRGIIIDLTEKKRVEEEQKQLETKLQRAQKMEVLGTMAGGVAHDLNNILSGIVSYPDLLLMQISPDNSFYKPIQIMRESGKKAAAIVQDLLTLTRRGLVLEKVLNINDVIHEYLESPEHEKLMSFHPKVNIILTLEDYLLNILGSRIHLTKTIMNLISNAAEAMPDGGIIRLGTKNQYLDYPLKGYDDIQEGDYAVLTISDNGTGIASEDIDRIFEPFFTKKMMGRSGTGLGMAVVWGAVKDHRGYIDVNSIEGRGTKFSLYFPVTRKKSEGMEKKDHISNYYGNGESVLLVDDVKEQRQIASDMLRQLGYRVHVVASGEEAVDYLRKKTVDILVLDMIMAPGMDGLDTYKAIKQLYPTQKAVIASGYSETARVKKAIRLGAGPYIKKPYTWIKLGQAVKTALKPKT
jgi:PAS domain S-box-containing protein